MCKQMCKQTNYKTEKPKNKTGYNLRVGNISELSLLIREIFNYSKGNCAVTFVADVIAKKYKLGEKQLSPQVHGKFEVIMNEEHQILEYDIPRELADFATSIENTTIIEAPLAFIEKAFRITIIDIKTCEGEPIIIPCLINRKYIDYVKLLDFLANLHNSNYLSVKFLSKVKPIYAQYIDGNFLRKSTFNTQSKKLSLYVNKIETLQEMFGRLTLDHVCYGVNTHSLPDLVTAFRDVAKLENYIFKYIFK